MPNELNRAAADIVVRQRPRCRGLSHLAIHRGSLGNQRDGVVADELVMVDVLLRCRFNNTSRDVVVRMRSAPTTSHKCTSDNLWTNASIVLLDLETNLPSPDRRAESFRLLLGNIRRAAPRAVIVFVAWPKIEGQLCAFRFKWICANMPAAQSLPENVSATELDLEALAARFHFDLLLTSMGMADARVLNTTKLKSTAVMIDIPPRFYADMIHPSPDGHGFIAELTARHISRQLRKHGCGLDGGGEASNEASHGGTRNGHEASQEALDSSRSVCYHTADLCRAAASNGFELVDGRSKKA